MMEPAQPSHARRYFVNQEDLTCWLDKIACEMRLIAPRLVENYVLYREVNSSGQIAWDAHRPLLSPKDAFLPPTERLFTMRQEGTEVSLIDSEPPSSQVLFGVRPCDAQGLSAMDALFLETEPVDAYYARRRESAILIGAACNQMEPSCFCTSLGGSPDDCRYVDLMLKKVGSAYSLEIISDKGAGLLDSYPLSNTGGDFDRSEESPARNPILSIPKAESWRAQFQSPFWQEMAERCIGCRICAYVCPTCRCFDVRDERVRDERMGTCESGKEHVRLRCWDSCTGSVYRRIAGGHNPRPEKGQRLRNRVYCKYDYYPAQFGLLACTGCGRCIDACPVGVDITEALAFVAQSPQQSPEREMHL